MNVDFVGLAQTLGVSVVVLFAIGVASWRGGKWLGKNVITPITREHINSLRTVTKSVKSLARSSRHTARMMIQAADRIEHAIEELKSVKALVVETHNVIIKSKPKAGSDATQTNPGSR